MRSGLRTLRRVLGTSVMLLVLLGSLAYVVYASNGILDEVQARETREARSEPIEATAVAMMSQPALVSNGGNYDVAEVGAGNEGQELPAVTSPVQESATGADTEPVVEASSTVVPETDVPTGIPTMTPTEFSTGMPADTATVMPTEAPSATPIVVAQAVSATPIPTNTPRPTATPMATLIPTNTPRPSATPTVTATPSPTVTATPTVTPLPSSTFTPSPTFTASPTLTPTYVIEGTYAVPQLTPVVAIPERAPLAENSDDIINFLLLGSDTSSGGIGHTDVIILVSVNKVSNTVAMWHIPRDLFVYIPNHTVDRINLAYALGAMNDYPGGGFGLMKETILYNMGIEVDHYARVDFNDFIAIVDELGGLNVSIDCAIEDWRLIDPEMDQTLEESWEYYTMPIGRQTLDPYMALWYVRSRKTTNDLDRGRRQMDVLRAIWYQAREQGLLTQVTQLWPEAADIIETDMTLTDVLSYVPLAVSLDIGNIARYSGSPGVHYERFLTPDDGRDVQLPIRDALLALVKDFVTPPTENRLGRGQVSVDIVDASYWNIGFDLVAADRVAWEGFSAQPLGLPNGQPRREVSVVYDYTGQQKGSALDDLLRVLRISDANVIYEPDPNRTVDYRVEIGTGYSSCVYGNAEDEIPAGPPVSDATVSPDETNVG